ncbi:tRNA (guanosine(46)-N7)-methyltransferase TrmB [Steroidobacter sp. S1-65]|uniref:tRNA (guanine-N(7)-)-methyltransferase n=1 Tax=Steroidobacter gossypii TaxID=2805490 RepID=A0ABS1WS48_9GAMM|nr:tRNA (guanosine(46)-N7)-methyltransferase TrmB [Steroidobacter gossypii]MBM0103792.1 tRNA (guanosine(46)-N7)-methyltransferase TrmB [Steroidobacter gossypii]
MTEDDARSSAPSRRTIRSFVIRGGRATAAQQRALDDLWPRYGVEFNGQPLDLDQLFGRRAPRMLEIGFGAGEALLAFAEKHPELDCIGVEVHKPGVGHLLLGAYTAGLQNLRVICHDAVEVLQQQLPPGSLQLIHIFFPDPWHKKRHHKRRLIQPEFVELLAQSLAVGGTLRLATDWEHYAMHMREVIDASPSFANEAPDTGFVARNEERPVTRFERRGHRLGHGVWDLSYRRIAATPSA